MRAWTASVRAIGSPGWRCWLLLLKALQGVHLTSIGSQTGLIGRKRRAPSPDRLAVMGEWQPRTNPARIWVRGTSFRSLAAQRQKAGSAARAIKGLRS